MLWWDDCNPGEIVAGLLCALYRNPTARLVLLGYALLIQPTLLETDIAATVGLVRAVKKACSITGCSVVAVETAPKQKIDTVARVRIRDVIGFYGVVRATNIYIIQSV